MAQSKTNWENKALKIANKSKKDIKAEKLSTFQSYALIGCAKQIAAIAFAIQEKETDIEISKKQLPLIEKELEEAKYTAAADFAEWSLRLDNVEQRKYDIETSIEIMENAIETLKAEKEVYESRYAILS
jgi:hypothetical protein